MTNIVHYGCVFAETNETLFGVFSMVRGDFKNVPTHKNEEAKLKSVALAKLHKQGHKRRSTFRKHFQR